MQSARFAASGARQSPDLEASESKPMRRAFRFEHRGCQPVRVVLTGTVSAELEQRLQARLAPASIPAGFTELAAGPAGAQDVFPEAGLLLSAELSGCAQAQHAVFELASALCRDLPATQVVNVRFLNGAVGTRAKKICSAPSTTAVALPRRRHALSRLHA